MRSGPTWTEILLAVILIVLLLAMFTKLSLS